MSEVYIVSSTRTAIGKFNGTISDVSSIDLGGIVIKEALQRSNVPKNMIDEIIMGNGLQIEPRGNPAREAALKAGMNIETTAFTVNKNCGSSNKAINLAHALISSGNANIIIAGGMENMSSAPYVLRDVRKGFRMGDRIVSDLLTDLLEGMGLTAENLAEKYNISREEQDELSYLSHMRAWNAQEKGYFKEQIVDIPIKDKKGDIIFNKDEGIRPDTTIEVLSKLQPVFKKDGTVTAGNSSSINDAASALILASEEMVTKLNLKPLARIVATASAGVDPNYMGIGPVPATKEVMRKSNLKLQDMDLIELNEAFAAQALAVIKELDLDINITNVNGSGISLGHPVGATGAILFTKMIYELKRRGGKYGLITLCIGGGQGIATIIENVE